MPNRLSTASGTALAATLAGLTQSGKIAIYTGSQPLSADSAATGTKLVEFTLDASPFDTATGGQAALSDVPLTSTALASGTAGWFRIVNSGGQAVIDGECGTTTGQLRLSVTEFVAGVQVQIGLGSITQTLAG